MTECPVVYTMVGLFLCQINRELDKISCWAHFKLYTLLSSSGKNSVGQHSGLLRKLVSLTCITHIKLQFNIFAMMGNVTEIFQLSHHHLYLDNVNVNRLNTNYD